jgi:hypothetical protein
VEGGGGALTVSGVSRNRGGFVKCVAIQKRLGIPGVDYIKNNPLVRIQMFRDSQRAVTLYPTQEVNYVVEA